MADLAQSIYKELSKDETITNIYSGDCRGCGECCSRYLPLTKQEQLAIKTYININALPKPKQSANVVNLMCPFLTDNKECMIYSMRPIICKVFRCDKTRLQMMIDIGKPVEFEEVDLVSLWD